MSTPGKQQLQVQLLDPAQPQPPHEYNISLTIAAAGAADKPEPTQCWVEGLGLQGTFADTTGALMDMKFSPDLWNLASAEVAGFSRS